MKAKGSTLTLDRFQCPAVEGGPGTVSGAMRCTRGTRMAAVDHRISRAACKRQSKGALDV